MGPARIRTRTGSPRGVPCPGNALPEGLEAWAAEPVVRGGGLRGKGQGHVGARARRRMTILELDARFPATAILDTG